MPKPQETAGAGPITRGTAALGFVVVVLASLVLLSAWAVSSPSGSSPDDDFHLASAWCISAAGADQCTLISEDRGYSIYELQNFPAGCYQFKPDTSGACSAQGNPQWRVNTNLYPGLFYEFSALFAGDDPAEFYVRARLAVVGSVVAILAAAYLVALPWLRPAMLVSWVAVAAPGLMSWVASNNPSAWGIVGLAAAWGPMTTAYLASSRARQAAAAGVWLIAVVMAAGARGDTGIYSALMAMAGVGLFVVLPRRDEDPPPGFLERAWRSWFGVAGSLVAFAIVTLLIGGTEQAGMASGGFWEQGERNSTDAVLWSVVLALPGLIAGLWGAPGGVNSGIAGVFSWYDTAMPPSAWIPALLAVGALVVAGVGILYARKTLAVLALLVLIVAIPTRSLLQDGAIVGELFQARYLAPLVVVLVGIVLVPSRERRIRFNQPQAALLALFFALAGTIGLHAWLRRFVSGTDVLSINLTGSADWWEFTQASPNQVWVIGSVAWLIIVTAAARALLEPRNTSQTPSSHGR